MAGTDRFPRLKKSFVTLGAVFLITAPGVGYYFIQYTIRSNFREVTPGKVYRSGQPTPAQLREWIQHYGIRTVINLRGHKTEFIDQERAVAHELGVELITFELSAYRLPPRSVLAEILQTLERVRLPVLVHCREGVDRAGTVSALAAMAFGVGYDQAKRGAYVPPGPWKRKNGGDHISDLFVLYEEYCRANRLDTDNWQTFKHWATNIYQPSYHFVEIRVPGEIQTTPGDSLALPVCITNKSQKPIPASDPKERLSLVAYVCEETREGCCVLTESRTPLPQADILPGESLCVAYNITTPQSPGDYTVFFDLIEKADTTFGQYGSPVPTCRLVVQEYSSPDTDSSTLTQNYKLPSPRVTPNKALVLSR